MFFAWKAKVVVFELCKACSPRWFSSEHTAGRVSLCDVPKGPGAPSRLATAPLSRCSFPALSDRLAGCPQGKDCSSKHKAAVEAFWSFVFVRRMNRKRELFQIPPDMSPAETGNQAASWNGTGAHYGVFGQMYSTLVTCSVVGTARWK